MEHEGGIPSRKEVEEEHEEREIDGMETVRRRLPIEGDTLPLCDVPGDLKVVEGVVGHGEGHEALERQPRQRQIEQQRQQKEEMDDPHPRRARAILPSR